MVNTADWSAVDRGAAPAAGLGDVVARLDALERKLDVISARIASMHPGTATITEALARIEWALARERASERQARVIATPGNVVRVDAQDPAQWPPGVKGDPYADGTLLSSITGEPVTPAQWAAELPSIAVASGGIDHDDAKALKRMADDQYTDEQTKLDPASESKPPWWQRLR